MNQKRRVVESTRRIVGSMVGLGIVMVLVVVYFPIEKVEYRSPIRDNDRWACPNGYTMIFYDGKHSAHDATEEEARSALPIQISCERGRSILLIWLHPDPQALKPVDPENKVK